MDLQKNDKIEVTIESLGYKGEGVARIDRVPVFINGALPGERVRAHIILVKSSYAVAKLLEVLSPSDKRVQPGCKYFGKCGGCNVQHMEREAQLEFKKGLVEDALHKIARMEAEVQPTQASEKQYGYRNKLSLPVRKSRDGTAVGLFAYNSHRVVEIDDCPLQSEGVRGLIPKLHKLAKYFPPYDEESGKGVLRHFVARDLGGKLSLTVVATRNVSEKLKSIANESGLGVDELWLNINRQKNNVIMGDETILIDGTQVEVDVLGLTTTVHPKGFMQVNDGVMKKLYTAVLDKAKELAPDLIIDAYSGGGTLTALLSRVGKKIIGVEIEQAAVDSANALMQKQGITNVTNYCADCAQLLPILLGSNNSELVEGSQEESHFGKEYRPPEQEYRPPEQEYRPPEQEYRHPELGEGAQSQEILRLRSRYAQYDDGLSAGKSSLSVKGVAQGANERTSRTLIVLDPPRSGCDKSVIEAVNACGAENIIYVSCNPSTLARDLALLTSYATISITPFDMFPQCAHVESVVCLTRSDKAT